MLYVWDRHAAAAAWDRHAAAAAWDRHAAAARSRTGVPADGGVVTVTAAAEPAVPPCPVAAVGAMDGAATCP